MEAMTMTNYPQRRDIPPLPENTILLVEVGSTAHGTGLPGHEDHDELGILLEHPTEVFGLSEGYHSRMQRTQPEGVRSGPGDTDRTLYSLRKYLYLAASGNPSILMSLYAPVIFGLSLGYQLRGLAPAFVGRHVIPKYRGYMKQQGERMLGIRGKSGHGKRGGGQRTELIAEHGYDTKFAMHCARLGFQGIELVTTGKLELPVAGSTGEWLRACRRGEIPFQEWWDTCLLLDSQLEALQSNEAYPAKADTQRIVNFSVEAHTLGWGWLREGLIRDV
jgi:hypothetical protein